jgi:ribonuclease J
MREMPADKVLVLISGTQGEPMSALSRAAVNNHKFARIEAGDTVVLSSRIIPGNEKSIYRMIDHLERRDAKVIYDDGTQGLIHVSGHGSQEELRLMINLLRPKFFIPIHGDYRHLKRHAELAGNLDIVEKVILLEDGEILDLDKTARPRAARSPLGASASMPAAPSTSSRMWSSATASTSPKAASCCPSSPSTNAPARWKASPRS